MKRAVLFALIVAAAGYLGCFLGIWGCVLGVAASATGCIIYELESLRYTIKLKDLPEEAEQ